MNAAWHMSTEERTTDPISASPRLAWFVILVVSKVSEPTLKSDVTCRSACTRGNSPHYPAFFPFPFARTVAAHDTQNLRHWVFCASVPSNYR